MKARRLAAKKYGKQAIAGKDIDHKVPLDQGGSNSESNLRIRSRRSNRSYPRTKTGQMKSGN